MKLKFSIRYKILSMVTALLVGAIGMYLLLATRIFEQDKQELVFDLNRSLVTTMAAEVDSTLRGVADKMRFYARTYRDGADSNAHSAFQEILADDPFLVRMEVYELGFSKNMDLISKISDPAFVNLYHADDGFFQSKLEQARPIPFSEIQSSSVKVWNATVTDGPALLGMGIPVIREGAHGVPEKIMAVVGYVKADVFIKNLKSSTLTHAFIVGSDGKVLVHTDPKVMIANDDMSSMAIVKALKDSPVSVGVTKYAENNDEFLGAFAHVGTGGLGVVSRVESRKAFSAVTDLVKRSLQFALIVSTITFIATIFFSRTLTSPLQKLMAAMERVSGGKLDVELEVKSRDEIAFLAKSFNQMTVDLRTSRFQLEEINRELESKVIDRTKKLEEQNRAVQEAQEALLRTTRLASVGEIAGRTAHEVLNPLTSLMARIQKVQKRVNDEVLTHKNLLGEIVSAWKNEMSQKGIDGFLKSLEEPSRVNPNMTLLQEDLSNISEIFNRWDKDLGTLEKDTHFLLQQAGRIERILKQMRSLTVVSNHKSKLRVHALIHDAINILADLFSKNGVQVLEKFEAGDDEVKLDRDEMIQVLTNMLRNSLHALVEKPGESGQRSVQVVTSNGGGKLYIDIIDDGMGIRPEDQHKLFESQFSTKTPDLGTGLGLSISRRFVRAFDGDVYLLKSIEGGGAVFRIELPLVVGEVGKGAAA